MNGLSFIETYSPNLNGSTDEKIQVLADNLHQMGEQMRFTLSNLGPENFNEASLNEMLSPIYNAISVLDARIRALGG